MTQLHLESSCVLEQCTQSVSLALADQIQIYSLIYPLGQH